MSDWNYCPHCGKKLEGAPAPWNPSPLYPNPYWVPGSPYPYYTNPYWSIYPPGTVLCSAATGDTK